MKYLCNHSNTTQALNLWARKKHIVFATFFFSWYGSSYQKSLQGLFRSLLFEILRACPGLIPVVRPEVRTIDGIWFGLEPGALHCLQDDLGQWSLKDLMEAFNRLKTQRDVQTKFCFFVDGLNEYEGEHSDLLDLLKNLSSCPEIKICVSSRPWNIFKDYLGQDSDTKLTLEDMTAGDIESHIRGELNKSPSSNSLKAQDAQYQQLIQDIQNKAQGVFLWVVLVVRSLIRGLTNADRIRDLQKRTESLPGELEDYFRHMFAQVEDLYQEQTARVLLMALHCVDLRMMTLAFTDEDELEKAMHSKIEPISPTVIEIRNEEIVRRLDGWCKGLLEKQESPDQSIWGPFFDVKVRFMHRTVRDFLQTKDMQAMLTNMAGDHFNPRHTLCLAFLAQ